ncbi:glycosyltransferase family 4 protein [Leptolyngbya sp. FACHB-541]|uniref:glycosyltransferase family 4 protein n=1 Tax=Leptolyngbya sp. FACHB-541 TaxID=2692810 RepID=UPI0016894BA3|nr:glycosyltransferase family 4 protein [Leptolyngbya sp. FACHB-541]MBD1997534.1 glycosyltransferase family 4 protein [Leptolyngbya sp. FACHB-541]
MRLLLLSTPVGPLGSGLGGGVELTLHNIAQELHQRGHSLQIVAPQGSQETLPLVEIAGNLQVTAQTLERDAPISLPANAVLANIWEYARRVEADYDLLVNFAYDWLPFYLTPFLRSPIAHLVSMGSLSLAMDQAIEQVAVQFPGTIGVHSQAQADTFAFAKQCRCLGNGLDLSRYQFQSVPNEFLAWVGRIAPEKGIEDAIAASQQTGTPLKVLGAMPDPAYWQQVCQAYPDAPVSYEGFLPTQQLQQVLGQCRGLLMTPRWVEAFGNVAIEALACGVPVIAYRRGGPAEIVQHGKTGWLVEPDSVESLVDAIAHLDQIDRHACRQQAEAQYSMSAMGDRIEAWFSDILRSAN